MKTPLRLGSDRSLHAISACPRAGRVEPTAQFKQMISSGRTIEDGVENKEAGAAEEPEG
jgi:hypothetical protein